MWLSLHPSSLCLSAFLSLNVTRSVWLTTLSWSDWQLCLPRKTISLFLTCLIMFLSTHPALVLFSPPHASLLILFNQVLLLVFLLFIWCFSSWFSFGPPSSLQWRHQPSGPIYLCVRQQLEHRGGQMPAISPSYMHTHTQRLCPDKTEERKKKESHHNL